MQLKLTAMKPKIFLSNVIFPLLMLSLFNCKEDAPITELDKLPPATQSGAGTFGCLVDGKAWVIEMPASVHTFYQSGSLGIPAGLLGNQFNSAISLHVFAANLEEKTYDLKDGFELMTNNASYYSHNTGCDYRTTNFIKGSLAITHLDQVNYKISGLFEFEAYSSNCFEKIKITNGRFDVHYIH
jgi:hypothetical protein